MKVQVLALLLLALPAILIPGIASAQDAPGQQWAPLPGHSLYSIMNGEALPETLSGEGYTHTADVVSTDALSWPDGRSAFTTLVMIVAFTGSFEPIGTEYYRCIDWMDADFRANGFECWNLIEPK